MNVLQIIILNIALDLIAGFLTFGIYRSALLVAGLTLVWLAFLCREMITGWWHGLLLRRERWSA